jgi:GTP-binding protein LepA
MELCQERRGEHTGMHYLSSERVQLSYDLPLSEIVLTSSTSSSRARAATRRSTTSRSGCGPSNLVKLDVLLGGDPVDALSMVVHRDKAFEFGKALTEKLRKKIPRQQYDVPIQAAIGAKIIARETVKASARTSRQVLRRRHHAQAQAARAQKEGKKRMKQVGRHRGPAGAPSWRCSSSGDGGR